MGRIFVVLLAVLVLPARLVGGLLRWFWRLSKVADSAPATQLPTARWRGLLAIACVASLVVYGWLDTVTRPTSAPPGPGAGTPTAAPLRHAVVGRLCCCCWRLDLSGGQQRAA